MRLLPGSPSCPRVLTRAAGVRAPVLCSRRDGTPGQLPIFHGQDGRRGRFLQLGRLCPNALEMRAGAAWPRVQLQLSVPVCRAHGGAAPRRPHALLGPRSWPGASPSRKPLGVLSREAWSFARAPDLPTLGLWARCRQGSLEKEGSGWQEAPSFPATSCECKGLGSGSHRPIRKGDPGSPGGVCRESGTRAALVSGSGCGHSGLGRWGSGKLSSTLEWPQGAWGPVTHTPPPRTPPRHCLPAPASTGPG